MGKATWLGDKETPDLKEIVRWGITFPKDKAVEVDNPMLFGKLKGMPSFKTEVDPRHPEVLDPVLHRAPSEMGAQGPADKPGEPVAPMVAAYEPPPPPEPEVEGARKAPIPASAKPAVRRV